MSAYVVSKTHIDVLVRVAISYGRDFTWWQVDEVGGYAGWRKVDELAERQDPLEQERRGLFSPSQLGQILVSENVRSVSHRYSEPGRAVYYGSEQAATMDDTPEEELPGPCDRYYLAPYVYENPGYTLTPPEVFAAIDCLDYQSCEHDEWRSSEAFAFLTMLRYHACRHVDGFEDAPREWAVEDLKGRHLEFSRRII